MDNFELRFWLETWLEEQERALAIKRAYGRAQIEIIVMKALLDKLKAKDEQKELSVQEKPIVAKIGEKLTEAERYFVKMEREHMLRHVDLMVIEERIKIIEEKIGSTELLAQQKGELMKNIFSNREPH